MYLLPRGKTIKESLDTAKLKMPDALLKMCANHFSGYLSFESADAAGVLVYAHGKIVAALHQSEDQRICGENALEMIFRTIQSQHCLMGVYRLEDDFVAYVQQFCHSKVAAANQMVDLLDMERLGRRVQEDNFSGSLRLHSDKRVVLIFYSEGKALGFFRDGDTGLSTDVDVNSSIVKDENCLLDILPDDSNGCTKCKLVGANLEKVWLQVWRELNP